MKQGFRSVAKLEVMPKRYVDYLACRFGRPNCLRLSAWVCGSTKYSITEVDDAETYGVFIGG